MLEATDLSFAYNAGRPDAIAALRGVSLRVHPGELVAIIGHNGSGKSTLARLLCAILQPTSGALSVDGIPATPEHVWEIRRRVGMVFQRPDDQLVANTVIDDVAFGPENLGLPRGEIERRVREVLEWLGLAHLAHAQISELSGGEKQRVAVAGVLAMRPAYLILDEPTTMIAPALARRLLALAHELRDRAGLSVLHITHFMHEVVSFDRVVVLDAGQVLMEGAPREVFARADELRAVGLNVPQVTRLGRSLRARGVALPEAVLTADELREALAQLAPAKDQRPTTNEPQPRQERWEPSPDEDNRSSVVGRRSPDTMPPLISVRDLSYTYMAGTPLAQEALRGVSCAVFEGETLALLGGAQAGKSTLIEFFNALRIPPPGHVFYAGADVAAPGFDLGRLRDEVGVVFQQPETQLFEETVGKDVSFVPRRKGLPPAESRAIVQQALTDVGLDYETFRLRYIYALSGGQKRRVAIAGVLAARPRVLVLDEPVAGLDPRGRAELAALIADLTRRLGLTVVLVGNAVDELAQLATRAVVLHEGRVALEGPLRTLLGRAEELHALGLELGEPAEIALALRPLFPDLPTDVLTLEELEEALLLRLAPVPRS
ncbi:MAG TPA: energy-coupling factor transporter ATPase [Roseiflexaceae bacterium]|nr:energy-coupling factor transporter ATPase [Roseiflexaceae bacterium]